VEPDTRLADVAEGVRATIAAYAQALDEGRTDDVVATFTPDGVAEIQGFGTFNGHDELRAAYGKWKPRRPQRHLVLNTVVTDWSHDRASATSDVIFILLGDGGWSIQLVARYDDTLHNGAGTWRFHRRTARFVTDPPPDQEKP
jgi:hypothetical protein